MPSGRNTVKPLNKGHLKTSQLSSSKWLRKSFCFDKLEAVPFLDGPFNRGSTIATITPIYTRAGKGQSHWNPL